MAQQYIGVYATHEKAPSLGEFPRPMGTRKRLWFVWEMPEGKHKVQALNAVFQPMAEPRIIPSKEFLARFVYQPDCFYAPEGAVHPNIQGVDLVGSALPDLFLSDGEGAGNPLLPFSPQQAPPGQEGKVLADDPNLLVAWAKAEPVTRPRTADPIKMPFDRLVGEVVAGPEPGGELHGGIAKTVPNDAPAQGAAPRAAIDENVEEVRQLRSRFVQALLLLRRGARTESLNLLEEMLAQPHAYFEGGALLFSEFGLGLRRLGFIPLALAAHKRALEFAPNDARVLFNIARTYHDLALLPEARDYLEKALAVAPDFAVARQFLMFLEASDPPGGV